MSSLKSSTVRFLKPLINRVPALSTALRRYRDNRLDVAPVKTPLGFMLQGNALMQGGLFECRETELVQALLRNTDTFVNVGANIGYYCCVALQAGTHVIAFEPLPANLHHLMRNLRHNGWQDRCEVFPIALSDKSGVIDFYGGGVVGSLVKGWADVDPSYVTLVPVNTADSVLGSRLSGQRCLFLVDVEGAENQMLAGASRLLTMDPSPVWLVEITITEHLPGGLKINPALVETFDRFLGHGYRVWVVAEVIREVLREELVRVANSGVDTLHSHNFLFSRDALVLRPRT